MIPLALHQRHMPPAPQPRKHSEMGGGGRNLLLFNLLSTVNLATYFLVDQGTP